MAASLAWIFLLSAECCAVVTATTLEGSVAEGNHDGMLDTDAAAAARQPGPGVGPSATSECVEDSQAHESWRGPGESWTQRLAPQEAACLSWTPSQAGEPPRPAGCLGPLEQLIGTWQGFGHATIWEPTAPFPAMQLQGPRFTTAPKYLETLTFKPIIGTAVNKGYSGNDHLTPRCRVEQALHGVSYTQEVRISWGGELKKLLHSETGVLMYNVVPGRGSNWTVSRMGAIPRGITFNAYGNHEEFQGDDVKDRLIQELSSLDLGTTPTDKCVDYLSKVGADNDSPLVDMHSYLINSSYAFEPIEQSSAVEHFVKIDLPEATILSSPFLSKAAKVTNFKSTFFVESMRLESGEVEQRLQYAQSSHMEFSHRLDCITCPGLSRDADGCYPQVTRSLNECFADPSLDPTCKERPYISWPHVQVANLKKVA